MDDQLFTNHGTSDATEQFVATQAALTALEKQIGRVGREQFKANTVAETQATQLGEALDLLRDAGERREGELTAQRDRSSTARMEARQDVARAVLPALDGLEEAMRSGQLLLAQPIAERRPESLLRSLLGLGTADNEGREAATLRAALESWLQGLAFVRRRLLDVLAAEGIVPIEAVGQVFDPRQHVAIEIVPTSGALPADTVAYELRRGYLNGDRILRHAEVAVASDTAT